MTIKKSENTSSEGGKKEKDETEGNDSKTRTLKIEGDELGKPTKKACRSHTPGKTAVGGCVGKRNNLAGGTDHSKPFVFCFWEGRRQRPPKKT